MMSIVRHAGVQFAAVAIVLGAVAAAAPSPPYLTDRPTYEATERQFIVKDCSDLHCFRVLVPWVLGVLPGPSPVKWKIYAVLANAGAAVAVGRLCLLLGLSSRAALIGTSLSALGFGSLYTLFDCYTSDPLMYLLGPILTAELLTGRRGRAGMLATLGVLAKEFAAAPLWIFALWAFLQRRWDAATRVLLAALTATLVWLTFELVLMMFFNYSYGGSRSADWREGSYLGWWLHLIGPRAAASALFGEYGALYMLMPVGLMVARHDLRLLALSAVPAVLVLAFVQQPDRALWNFHFIAIPLAVLVLERLPAWTGALFVACFGLANLRLGAQLAFVPAARFALALSIAIAAAAIVATVRGGRAGAVGLTRAEASS